MTQTQFEEMLWSVIKLFKYIFKQLCQLFGKGRDSRMFLHGVIMW